MKPVSFGYLRARTLDEALEDLAEGEADGKMVKILAGGQSLGPMLNLRLARPDRLVDIRDLAELTHAEESDGYLELGAMTTHASIEDRLVPDVTRGLLAHVAAGIAYRPVRNRGTLGGSLAHADPAADWVGTMWALGARVVIASPRGMREELVSRFIRGAFATGLAGDEILAAIRIPKLSPGAGWGYHKIYRKLGEFSDATGIVIMDPERGVARVVMAATVGPPRFLPRTAAALAEAGPAAAQPLIEEEVASLLADLDPVDLRLHAVAIRRAIQQVYPS